MRKRYDSKFKSRVALEAIQGDRSIAEIASEYNVHPNQVTQWKKKLLEESANIFATESEKSEDKKYTDDDLMCKIGQLEMENNFLLKKYDSYLLRKGKNS